jgi:hypothetical protein
MKDEVFHGDFAVTHLKPILPFYFFLLPWLSF